MTGGGVQVLCVGTVALDSVQTPAGEVRDAPGGSALYFAAAARFFARVAVAGAVGSDFPVESLTALEAAGVDLSALERRRGESFRWSVRYGEDFGERETLATNRGTMPATPPAVPPSLRAPAALFLGSTDPSIQGSVLDVADGAGLVVLDTMGHWVQDRRHDLLTLLPRVHVLLVNQEEASLLGGSSAPPLAAAAIRALGPAWVVIKRGQKGAVAFGPDAGVSVPAQAQPRLVDPTGAGDAFAGGVVGTLASRARSGSGIDPASMRRALAAGVVTGALAVSSFSLNGLLAAAPGDVVRMAGS